MHNPRFTGFREGVFSLIPSVLGVGLAVTLCFVVVLVVVVFPLPLRSRKGMFCTLDDPVFQAIRANQSAWIDRFTVPDVVHWISQRRMVSSIRCITQGGLGFL